MKRVVIVGGGITGLAVAHAIERGDERSEVRLVEARPHLGGDIETERYNGFIIDAGPSSWSATSPAATRLVSDVGLADELIGARPEATSVYVAVERRLHRLPDELELHLPRDLRAFRDTELLGWDAKLRALLDRVVPARAWAEQDDEALTAFVARRLGNDVAERIAAAVFGTAFAADPASLSVRACAPWLVTAEKEHGSVLGAVREARERSAAAEVDALTRLSLKRGIGDLVVNVAHKLRDAEILTSHAARAVERLAVGDPRGRWAVTTSAGTMHADDVVLAVPGHAAAALLEVADPELAAECAAMRYTSVASVFLAFKKFDVRHPLDTVGILVPRSENRLAFGCAFVSTQWEHRAPAGQVLLRVDVGGVGNEDLVERSDAELVRLARGEVRDLLGIVRPPMFGKVYRRVRSCHVPTVGHLSRMARLFERVARIEGLHLGGTGYGGNGIADAVRQGEAIASRIGSADRR